MQRVTVKDVRVMFGRTVRSAIAAGITGTDKWELHEGSKINGNAFVILNVHRLGMTAREAYSSLYAMAVAFELVESARSDDNG